MRKLSLPRTVVALMLTGLTATAQAVPPLISVWPAAGSAGTTREVPV